jgi:response regulator NasT
MINVIVLFPKLNDAKSIRNILVRTGIDVTAVCTAGSQVISRFGELDEGIVICGYRFADMMYTELQDYLPKDFEILLIVSRAHQNEMLDGDHITCISMPLKVYDLVNGVQDIMSRMMERKRKRRRKLRERSPEEKRLIESAKELLMQNNGITEADAHSYLQKRSMDSGMSLLETARMILDTF